jgi:hypothetical protein
MKKFLREVKRFGRRSADLLLVLSERMAQARRDCRNGADLRLTDGVIALGPRLALFVIWQPGGVAGSTLMTCRHLAACGFVPIVISNAALSEADQAALVALSGLVIERPNIGHDFGAWRDAILFLIRASALPTERLVLINDSIWFPLRDDDRLLRDIDDAAQKHGFTGAAWMERPGRAHRAHFQSYLLMFGPKALDNEVFRRFWVRYLASSRRDSVLRRGEKGISKAMIAAGLAGPPTISPQRLLAHAEAAPTDELIRILDYAALTDPGRRAIRNSLLAAPDEAGFRPAALQLISQGLMSGYFAEANPYLVARAFGMHFLKKRREATSTEGRLQFLRAVANGHLPAPDPSVLAEIMARDQ